MVTYGRKSVVVVVVVEWVSEGWEEGGWPCTEEIVWWSTCGVPLIFRGKTKGRTTTGEWQLLNLGQRRQAEDEEDEGEKELWIPSCWADLYFCRPSCLLPCWPKFQRPKFHADWSCVAVVVYVAHTWNLADEAVRRICTAYYMAEC